jgi:hypothetical protein
MCIARKPIGKHLATEYTHATIREAVFTTCCSEPREVEDRAVPSRTAPERFQGNDL